MSYKIEDYKKKAREAVAEGVVLLRNEDNVLPLKSGAKVAVFGRTQIDYFKSGTGSGGLVNASYVVNIIDALVAEENLVVNADLKATYEKWIESNPFDIGVGWATEPWFQKEMLLTPELVKKVKEQSDVAIVVIGRTAGEAKDNKAEKGSYFITDDEEEVIRTVTEAFENVIVLLNTGNVIDMNWVEKYKPKAVAYVWQGGQEGGNGIADVLVGRVTPSGKLPDTIVYDVNDIPSTATFGALDKLVYEEDIYVGYRYFETFAKDKVQYPFGFGLSYTKFLVEVKDVNVNLNGDNSEFKIVVTNKGDVEGKEVVQIYAELPQGVLGKSLRNLVGFSKTKTLKPNESEELKINIPTYYLASYDDSGVTGHKSAYVLEAGEYKFFVGTDVRTAVESKVVNLDKLIVVEQLSEAMAPITEFEVVKPKINENGVLVESLVKASMRTVDYDERLKENLPLTYEITGDLGYKLSDVANGKVSMEQFVAQLGKEELASIVRGEGMSSPKATPGIAGAFGGVTESLKAFGIPIAGCADGPSGIRMDCGVKAFSMPNGTLLASTFNEKLCEELYEWEGLELRKNKIDTLLGPGINIHRSPLNGRNFEYFSEDPILTGKMAAAQLKGMQKYNVTGTIKHFACNNQEADRDKVESIASERAIREIYLKGFEIAVKEAGAYSIMTSYNPINGYWSASNYELLTVILREEWNYKGIVMTDWWARANFTGEYGELTNASAKIQAQNDLIMVNPDASDMKCDNSIESLESGKVSVGDYQRCAINICEYLINAPVYDRAINGECDLDVQLKQLVFERGGKISKTLEWDIDTVSEVRGTELAILKDDRNLILVSTENPGVYSFNITCCAMEGEYDLAQLPVTVFCEDELIGVLSVVGSQKELKTFVVGELKLDNKKDNRLEVMFSQGGMNLKSIELKRK